MDDEAFFKPLKIDHAMLNREHARTIMEALDAVWGETNHPFSLGWVEAGIVSWAVRNGYNEPVKTARDFMVEAASLGLIVKRGGRWVRPSRRRARGGRKPD